MYIGSQWFAIPRHLVEWYLVNDLPNEYIYYAQHVIVADENYFQTLFKNSPYCGDLITTNFLFVLFDKWENERVDAIEDRDPRKCLSPNPNFCGRSPTTLTLPYKKLIEVTRDLFARKFDSSNPSSLELLSEIDIWRSPGYDRNQTGNIGDLVMIKQLFIDMNETYIIENRCMEMSYISGDPIKLVPCDPSSDKQWFRLGTVQHHI